MRTHRLAFIDLETTGLEPEHHEIIEIGLVLAEQFFSPDKKISLRVIDEWEIKVKPEHIERADPQSLLINHYNPADWIFSVELKNAMEELSKKTDNSIMVAHNMVHDYEFIKLAFHSAGVENKMHYHKLDTISIAFAKLYGQKEIEKLSLRVLCEHFGVKNIKSHSALSDARATFEVFEKLMAL